jgi:FAD:protein FMN transferase
MTATPASCAARPGSGSTAAASPRGWFADVLAGALDRHAAFAVDCAGDLRLGGAAGVERPVQVESPFDRRVIHTFGLASGGVATSGIGRRSWLDVRGRPAHHLLDPATGRPAFTGLVQVTALAATALEAEIRAKAAILSGPDRARDWLGDGGVIVADDGGVDVVAPPTATGRPAQAGARPSHARRARQSAPSAGTAPAGAAARQH